jgi:hypothetical protein
MEMNSEQKTKVVVDSKAKILASASVVMTVTGWLLGSFGVLGIGKIYLLYICWLIWFVACLCGIMSLRAMKNIKGFLWSRLLAWIGCIFSIYCALSILITASDILYKDIRQCRSNLKVLSRSIIIYCEKHDGEFPDPSKWCDLLLSEPANISNEIDILNISEKRFKCPIVTGGRSGYAFNKNLAGKRISEVDPNTVVLFETNAAGWNQNGGPEIMCPDRHKGIFVSGSYVICIGKPTVRFVPRSEVKNLRWNP